MSQMTQQLGTGGQQQYQSQDAGTLPQQYRQALQEVAQSVQVCGWCADQCIREANPSMIECIRLCEDVVEIGEALLAVAPRSSRSTGHLVSAFQQAAQECAQECGQHSHSHCQECASVLPQAAQAVQQLQGGQQMQQNPRMGGQQMQQRPQMRGQQFSQ